jgi:hypothetical protein
MIQYQVEVLDFRAAPLGTSGGRHVPLNPDRVFIAGRSLNADIHLPFAGVSRRHAELEVIAGCVWVRDLDSGNGTWINGRQFGPNAPQRLRPGDVIQIAAHWLRLQGTVQLDRRWLRWNGGTAPAIARHIRAAEDLGAFPVLADVLEEAGCDDADLLALCRRPQEWAFGGWILDALLGEAEADRPTFAESWWLLRQSGWRVCEEAVTGPPQAPVWRVTVRQNAGGVLEATGKTWAEAWHRAVAQARAQGLLGLSKAQ